jgi:hypothetical protein
MLNGRLYRVAFVPFLFALALAAFSLSPRPRPLSSTLAPDAFDGARAFSDTQTLAAAFPARRPASAGDEALARHVARTLEGLGGTAGGGFTVRVERSEGKTIDGRRSLATVIAERPGSTSARPIVIVAHRDAAARGSAAELSGTAALIELARVFAARETKRAIVLVSTSGGSGGDAGAAQLPAQLHGPFDAAIVLGDLAGTSMRRPIVLPFSDGLGSAPLQLQRTVADSIKHEADLEAGAPSALGQLAHLMFPLAIGEQGVLDANGIPAVLVQVSGERGPAPGARVGAQRLQGLGRSVLAAVDALDVAPDISAALQTNIVLARQRMPEWAVRLLGFTLLLPVLLAAVDGLARMRRRRMPVARGLLWTLSCAFPFFLSALLAYLFGWLGVLEVPSEPVPPGAIPAGAKGVGSICAIVLTFAMAWLLWRRMVVRLGWKVQREGEAAALGLVLVLLAVTLVGWIGNPFTALLALPALHLWLLLCAPELRARRGAALALVAIGLLPLALLIAFYAHQLGLGPGGLAWSAVLLLAGGHVGFGTALLWCLAFGCAAAAALVAGAPEPPPVRGRTGEALEVTIRGPLSYAGPGSLGGTESALRR